MERRWSNGIYGRIVCIRKGSCVVMLKSAIYCNVFIVLIMSMFFRIRIINKKSDLKIVRKLVTVYLIYNFISFCFCCSEIVDIGWDAVFLIPVSILSFIVNIMSISRINKELKNNDDVNYGNSSVKKYIVHLMIPVIVFVIPYAYEMYIINNCSYLLKYNYQSGMIDSEDTYIAIVHNKPVTITLQKNLFNREGVVIQESRYDIEYTYDDIEISQRDSGHDKITIENEDVKKIALDARERSSSADEASIHCLSDGKYSIITLDSYGAVLGEYFYYNDTFIRKIHTHGDLESIICYE